MSQVRQVSTAELQEIVRASARKLLVEKARWRPARDVNAFSAFDQLVAMGCDSLFLVAMLGVFAKSAAADTWTGLTGFDNPDLVRTALKRIGSCSDDVERLLGGVIGKAFLQSDAQRELPATLRGTASVVRTVFESMKPETNFVKSASRAKIVVHVIRKTGRPRDRLVAEMLSPTFSCSERAQSQWRQDNRALILAAKRTQDGEA